MCYTEGADGYSCQKLNIKARPYSCDGGAKNCSHIRQEVIDCLIASRSAYELHDEGTLAVLERDYDLKTSDFDLLMRSEQSSIASIWDNQVFNVVRSSAGFIMVACRGTFSLSDVIADVKVAKLPMGFAKGRAQIGFVERAMDMPLELFLSFLRAGEKIIFTGHSLGGAVTSLAALRVLEALASVPGHHVIAEQQLQCITFGTAPFANLELAAYVNSRFRNHFHHIVSKHDVVPRAHNVLPHFFFPCAKWLMEKASARWELRVCKSMIETMTKMSVDKAVHKLEEKIPALWPATWLYRFLKECAAHDEEALFYGHVGNVLLLDPDTKDTESTILMEHMESLGIDFCVEDKTALDVFLEHGLANHYSCLVRALKDNDDATTVEHLLEKSWNNSVEYLETSRGLCKGQSLRNSTRALETSPSPSIAKRPLLRNPSRALFINWHQYLLRATGNEFPECVR